MAIASTPITVTLQATGDGAILFDAAAPAQAGSDRFDPLWFDAGHWRARGPVQQLGAGRGAALRVRIGAADWVLRHYHRGGMVARLLGDRYLWNGADRTRGFAEFRLLAALRKRDLPVPEPIAARYQRNGAHYRADLIMRRIEGVTTLAELLARQRADAQIAARVGTAIARFHANGAYHADLNAHNVLLDADTVWLIDFDRGELRTPSRDWQQANLARLQRSLRKLGAASDGEAAFERALWNPLMAAYERGGVP